MEEAQEAVADDPEEAETAKTSRLVSSPSPGVRDTPPIHQIAVVTATIDMGPTPGTVWPPSPAPGRTNVQPEHREGPADLEKRKVKNLITTLCTLR